MELVLKIALGVFIGALAAAFTWEGIQAARLEYAAMRANEEVKRILREQRQRDSEFARERAEQAQRDVQREAAVQRADALRKADEERRKVAREAAWSRFYQRSAECGVDSGTAACANEYMRARKRFDETYRD